MNIAILCGGKGTRLQTISKDKPKILVPIKEKPFIFLLLDSLVNNGFKKIFLLTSYKSKSIENEIGISYRNTQIFYIEDNKDLKPGTASALYNSLSKLPEHFLLQYGDTILDIDYKDFYNKSKKNKDSILMSIYDNQNNLDKNNILLEENKIRYYNSESEMNNNNIKDANYIDYGLLGMHNEFLKANIKFLQINESLKYFQEKLSLLNLIKPYLVKRRFYEIGTPSSYKYFNEMYLNGDLNKVISPNKNET